MQKKFSNSTQKTALVKKNPSMVAWPDMTALTPEDALCIIKRFAELEMGGYYVHAAFEEQKRIWEEHYKSYEGTLIGQIFDALIHCAKEDMQSSHGEILRNTGPILETFLKCPEIWHTHKIAAHLKQAILEIIKPAPHLTKNNHNLST